MELLRIESAKIRERLQSTHRTYALTKHYKVHIDFANDSFIIVLAEVVVAQQVPHALPSFLTFDSPERNEVVAQLWEELHLFSGVLSQDILQREWVEMQELRTSP